MKHVSLKARGIKHPLENNNLVNKMPVLSQTLDTDRQRLVMFGGLSCLVFVCPGSVTVTRGPINKVTYPLLSKL